MRTITVPTWMFTLLCGFVATLGATLVASLFFVMLPNQAKIGELQADAAQLRKQVEDLGGVPGQPTQRVVTVPGPSGSPVKITVTVPAQQQPAPRPRTSTTPTSRRPTSQPSPTHTPSPKPIPTPSPSPGPVCTLLPILC